MIFVCLDNHLIDPCARISLTCLVGLPFIIDNISMLSVDSSTRPFENRSVLSVRLNLTRIGFSGTNVWKRQLAIMSTYGSLLYRLFVSSTRNS